MRFFSTRLVLISAVAILSGCSDGGGSKNTSSLVGVAGWVGAQGFNNAQVVVNQVAESGQVAVSSADIYLGLRESTDARGKFTATVAPDETILYIARGQVANVDKDQNNLATTRQCQVASGCNVQGTNYSFASYYPATNGFEWRSVVYTQEKGATNNVNPITTLAAAYGYEYDVLTAYKTGSQEFKNETFTPYDVVLANSQVASLFGLTDIIGLTPANLTKLNNFTSQEQIRYAALIAAFQQLELGSDNADFMAEVVAQFVQDKGQLFRQDSAGNARQLALYELYTAAHENLTALLSKVTNSEAKTAVNAVIAKLKTDATPAEGEAATAITDAKPDDLSALLSATELSEISVGLTKTKLFVESLLDYQNYFWQAGYKSEIDQYTALLKTVGDKNKDSLNALVAEFALIQDYYVNCSIGGQCNAQVNPEYTALDTRYQTPSYNSSTEVLTLSGTGGQLTVSQKLADLNIYDSITEPASSQAIDVFITGSMKLGDLVLNLEHKMDSTAENIDVPSSMRIYYPQKVSSIQSANNAGLKPTGYEVIWGDFELYDKAVQVDPAGSALTEIELEGSFRIFYRGVQDPQNSNEPNDSELRFNIEELVLTSTISDNVDDDAGSDSETTTVVITASASNASDYYPANKFASFNGFFVSNENLAEDTIPGLLQLDLGTEMVKLGSRQVEVQTADFINSVGGDIRYRFYPTERVADDFDIDGDGNFKEKVDMHYLEECALEENNTISECSSKTRVFAKRDRQNTLNELWKLGVIQNINVPGRGSYFVKFPATKNSQGCFELDPLATRTMDGALIKPMVLGLDTVRLYTEINIKDSENVSLPRTLFDMTVVAPTKDRYRVNASLSHNYSSSLTDESGLILGSGAAASVIAVSYDTSSDFKNMGNVTIAKGGVELGLGDGITVTEDQDITAFLTQTYDPSSVHYKIVEGVDGQPERCVTSNEGLFDKTTATPAEQVFYLNYRDVLYGTARPEGNNNIWTIRYLDGSWLIPNVSQAPNGEYSGNEY